jgi:hypothetical protein
MASLCIHPSLKKLVENNLDRLRSADTLEQNIIFQEFIKSGPSDDSTNAQLVSCLRRYYGFLNGMICYRGYPLFQDVSYLEDDFAQLKSKSNLPSSLFGSNQNQLFHCTNYSHPASYQRHPGKSLILKSRLQLSDLNKSRHKHLSWKKPNNKVIDAVWACDSFLGSLRFSIKHNEYSRIPFQQFYVCVVFDGGETPFHPYIPIKGVFYCTRSVLVQQVWAIQCGSNGLLFEIGARLSLICRDGDISTKVIISYEMRSNGYVRI